MLTGSSLQVAAQHLEPRHSPGCILCRAALLLRRVCRSVFLTLVLLELRTVCCPTAAAQLQMLRAGAHGVRWLH